MEKRLNKFLSEAGYCSRREADRLIEKGIVFVNGKVATTGLKVNLDDTVTVKGEVITLKKDFVYIALNKPIGITSTTDLEDKDNIVDFMNYPERIFHVGRLDKDSEGLILMTNDGDIVNKILRSGNDHDKEYIVEVDKKLTSDMINQMRKGVPILDTVTKRCKVTRLSEKRFKITLTEGLNRQIRRMCSYLGYKVVSLKRVKIMHIPLDIESGKWRYLTPEEVSILKEEVKYSSKTQK